MFFRFFAVWVFHFDAACAGHDKHAAEVSRDDQNHSASELRTHQTTRLRSDRTLATHSDGVKLVARHLVFDQNDLFSRMSKLGAHRLRSLPGRRSKMLSCLVMMLIIRCPEMAGDGSTELGRCTAQSSPASIRRRNVHSATRAEVRGVREAQTAAEKTAPFLHAANFRSFLRCRK